MRYVVCGTFHSPDDGIVNGGRVGPASSMLFSLTTPTLTVYSTLGSRSLTVILVWLWAGTSIMMDACRLLLVAGEMITRYTKKPLACSRVTGCQLTVITSPSVDRFAVNITATRGPVHRGLKQLTIYIATLTFPAYWVLYWRLQYWQSHHWYCSCPMEPQLCSRGHQTLWENYYVLINKLQVFKALYRHQQSNE